MPNPVSPTKTVLKKMPPLMKPPVGRDAPVPPRGDPLERRRADGPAREETIPGSFNPRLQPVPHRGPMPEPGPVRKARRPMAPMTIPPLTPTTDGRRY